MKNYRSRLRWRKRCLAVAPFTLLVGETVQAQHQGPSWWIKPGNPVQNVIDTSVGDSLEGNKGMARAGQGKWMTLRAKEVLTEFRPDLAAQLPLPFVISDTSEPKAPLLIGQLKNLALPFYQVLNAQSPQWVRAQLAANGLDDLGVDVFSDGNGGFLPWDPADDSNREVNHTAATVGQLKSVFSLEFSDTPLVTDGDQDGLTDSWEIMHNFDPRDPDANLSNGIIDALDDVDGDGLTNRQEELLGTDPNDPNSPADACAPPDPPEFGSLVVSISDTFLDDDTWTIFYQVQGQARLEAVSNGGLPTRVVTQTLTGIPLDTPVEFTIQQVAGDGPNSDEFRLEIEQPRNERNLIDLEFDRGNPKFIQSLLRPGGLPADVSGFKWTVTLRAEQSSNGSVGSIIVDGQVISGPGHLGQCCRPDTEYPWTPPQPEDRRPNTGLCSPTLEGAN